jgi:hypothetical protein
LQLKTNTDGKTSFDGVPYGPLRIQVLAQGFQKNRIDPANEDKLVHVSGELKTTARLTDPDFAMSAHAALLVRNAEMFQWREVRDTDVSDRDKPRCEHSWSAERLDAACYRPHPPFPFPGMKVTSRDATLGAFRPGILVLEKLAATIELPTESATLEAARTHVGGPVQVTNGGLYLGSNPAQPQIGDIRISWRIAKAGPVSLIGRQAGTDLVAFQTSGNALLLGRSGTLSAVEMFKIESQESSTTTWGLRLFSGCFMLAGWVMALGRLVPALLVGGLIGLAATAGAWLEYRPLEAATALVVIGIVATIAVIRRWLSRFVPATRAG